MPRNVKLTTEEIALRIEAYAFFGTFYGAAKALGLRAPSIKTLVYRSRGLCRICGRERVPGLTVCTQCRDYQATYAKADRKKRKELGICCICSRPIAAPNYKHCRYHLEYLWDLRNQVKFDGNYYPVLQRANFTCQACGYRELPKFRMGRKYHYKIEVHHIDGDDTNHKLENLLVACMPCHRVITALNNCSHPEKTISFWLSKNKTSH
jgi:hypothetical protein